MKRVKVKPGKARSAFGFAVGIVFVMAGIFFAIPNFGLFGIFWTMVAAGIAEMTAANFGQNEKMIAKHAAMRMTRASNTRVSASTPVFSP